MYQIGICDDGKNTCAFIEDVVLKYGKKRNVRWISKSGIPGKNFVLI